jgi:hypothetical protein
MRYIKFTSQKENMLVRYLPLTDYRKSSEIRLFKQFEQGKRYRQPAVYKGGLRAWR